MSPSFQNLLSELERFEEDTDKLVSERPRRMLNITRDTGEFLSVLIRAMSARRVLEIETSNGYSTLWLASAARAVSGRVTTIERSDYKISLARQTFGRSDLGSCITLVHDDAGRVLERSMDESFDFIFLDSERTEYPGWWPHLKRVIRPGGLLVVDNATTHAEQMAPFIALVNRGAFERANRQSHEEITGHLEPVDATAVPADLTGFYKMPLLRGVWYRGPFEHNGSCATLEDWFNPRLAG